MENDRLNRLEISMAETRIQQAHHYALAEGHAVRLKEIEMKVEKLGERVTRNQIYLGVMVAVLSTLGSTLGSWVFQMMLSR